MRPAPQLTGGARRRQTYRWLLVPRRDRWPKRRQDWLPLAAVGLVVAGLLAAAGTGGPWLADRLGCRPGLLPSSEVWSAGGECVGVSAGRYTFGRGEFAAVQGRIVQQNAAADANPCGTGGQVATVGVLLTLDSPGVGGRAVHELEGIAAAQARANQPGCVHPIRLRVGQIGAAEQAAGDVAEHLAGSGAVAVVGMGLSDQQSANAATVLAAHHVPMVADLITAEGFDQNGSGDDDPVFTGCDPGATYQHGVGQDFFYRIAFRNAVQIRQLSNYAGRVLGNRLDFVLTPTTTSDPSPCTALPLLHREFAGDVQEVRFDPADATTVTLSARRICAGDKPVSVFYAARARDLARFLNSMQQQSDNGLCRSPDITVLSFSDAVRIRARELEPSLEQLRTGALSSSVLRTGKIRLIYTPLADPDVLAGPGRPASVEFGHARQVFTGLGFAPTDLDDGWGIQGYDALTAVAAALASLPAGQPVTRSQVNSAINGFSGSGQAVPGAGGSITFDNHGNRVGSPVVVRLCPPAAGGRPTTVEVYPTTRTCPAPTG
jgi:ABC-type branched-subunit amino acid transport system substrate-binding protein